MRIGIIGAGNMGLALARGILLSGEIRPDDLLVSDRSAERLRLAEELGVGTTASNLEVAEKSDVVFLAVKPAAVRGVLEEVREKVEGKLLVSVAAGVRTQTIEELCRARVIRLMPNICAEVGQMAACYSLGSGAGEDDGKTLERILRGAGKLFRVEEELMDAATAVCGSGPAFFLRLIKAAEEAAVELGFDGETARRIAAQVAKGAAGLAEGEDPERLIGRICTKGGTTEEGMKVLEKGRAGEVLKEAIRAAAEKSRQLGKSA